MGATVMMIFLVLTAGCALSLLMGGIGTLIVYIIQKRRGGLLIRRFVLIPIFSLLLGVLLMSYPVYWVTVIRTSNAEGNAADTKVVAYYDEDYNITLNGKRYIDFGALSSQSAQGAAVASLKETDAPPDALDKLFGNSGYTQLYAVTNGAKSDIITDGSYIYCEASQLEQVKTYYNDLGNYVYHAADEKSWYESETSALPVVDMDSQLLNSMNALESGTVLELRRETPDQKIMYLLPVSRDGVTEKFYELLDQNGRVFLVYSEAYEYDETVYICFKLPDTLNAYLLDTLF